MILVRAFMLEKVMSKPSHLYQDMRSLLYILWISMLKI